MYYLSASPRKSDNESGGKEKFGKKIVSQKKGSKIGRTTHRRQIMLGTKQFSALLK